MFVPHRAEGQEAANTSPGYMLMGMASITSDYMMRGISQTWGHGALQAGGELMLNNGFTAGFMASTISANYFPGGSAEVDLYASYGAHFDDDWSWRVGVYSYLYPGANLDKARPPLPSRSFNTFEVNAALTWKWLTLKYSRSLTDYMGIDIEQGYDGDSKGTQYLQLDAAIPLSERWSLALHAAHTDIPASLMMPTMSMDGGQIRASYSDFGASVKWQFHPNWSASLGATHATNDALYGHMMSFRDMSDMKDLGGTRGFVALQANW
jgi:uncharacterized protein (TIGR02001 family)